MTWMRPCIFAVEGWELGPKPISDLRTSSVGQVELGVLRYPSPGESILLVPFLKVLVFDISPSSFAVATRAHGAFRMTGA